MRIRYVPYLSLVSFSLILALAGCTPSPRYLDKPSPKQIKAHIKKHLGEPEEFKVGQSWTGDASWYGPKFHGRKTANGEVFDMNGVTAAHKRLPFNTIIEVTNLSNGKSCRVRVNDRGPFKGNRILDLSKGAAQKIGLIGEGVAEVKVTIISLGEN